MFHDTIRQCNFTEEGIVVAVVLTGLPVPGVVKVVVSSVTLSVVYQLGVSMLDRGCRFLPQGSLKHSVEHVVKDFQEALPFYFFSCVGAGCITFLYFPHPLALSFWLALALSSMIQLSLPALANYVCPESREIARIYLPLFRRGEQSRIQQGEQSHIQFDGKVCTMITQRDALAVAEEKVHGQTIDRKELTRVLGAWGGSAWGCLDGAYTSIDQRVGLLEEGRVVYDVLGSFSGKRGCREYVCVSPPGSRYSLHTIDPSSFGKGKPDYIEALTAIRDLYINCIILQAICDGPELPDLNLLRTSPLRICGGADGTHIALAEQNPPESYQLREFVQKDGELCEQLISLSQHCLSNSFFLDYNHAVVITSPDGQQQLVFRPGALRPRGDRRSVLFGFGSSQDLANAERAGPPSFTGGRGLIGLFENPTAEMFLVFAGENSILGAEIDLRDLEDAVQKQKEYVAQCRIQETVLSSEGEG